MIQAKKQLKPEARAKAIEEIRAAIEDKVQRINVLAIAQDAMLKLYRAIIAEKVKIIESFPFSFSTENSPSEIERMEKEYKQILQDTKQSIFIENLSLSQDIAMAIDEAFNMKQNEISKSARDKIAFIVEEANKNIEIFVEKIKNFEFCFSAKDYSGFLGVKYDCLIKNLDELSNGSVLQNALDIVPLANDRIQTELSAKKNHIYETAARIVLGQSGFLAKLENIVQMTMVLEKKAEKNTAYKEAASTARTLCDKLENASSNFLNKPDNIKEKLRLFKSTAREAIKEALPILKEHRGWKQVLADIASAIVLIVSGFGAYLATRRIRLFNVRTDTEKEVLDLDHNIQQIIT